MGNPWGSEGSQKGNQERMKGCSSLERQDTGAWGSPGWPASLVQVAVNRRGDCLPMDSADAGLQTLALLLQGRGVCACLRPD